ncbi:hypothetical protein A1Q2_00405 [Trichosporon asahii var. asahii CBS 8904]|uniref:Uncharacterized protein n=2 Tax=Trichosporon asahii var. asahii TaxID=189963 RepID=K1VM28_TRIAC|nr:hypothetical protein A1Q1_03803 [Trichosporon asahii var. asahii CBS 2479]EJT47402.1 hypothetical protein A1Q1_03803 [Trichosporon asahii var. asahii CBS 2479]EKD05175.1 hypothetical protein A1Q2_00405 [Trichosporon asahii var. asahii CBS 8904]
MGDCPWLNRPLHPSYDSRKARRVEAWTHDIERSDTPPESVVSLPQASLISDATFTTFGAGDRRPMPEGHWPEWFEGPHLGSWDAERDGLGTAPRNGEEVGGRRRSEGSGGRRWTENRRRVKVEQGDLRCDKTLPSLPPPTHSQRTVTQPLPTPELTIAGTQTTSRPSFIRTQSQPLSQPQSQPMGDRLAPPQLGPWRHSDTQVKEVVYLKPTRNSLALRPASFVMQPNPPLDSQPKSPERTSLKPLEQKPLSLRTGSQNVKPKEAKPKSLRTSSQRPTSLKPSSIQTVPIMEKRKPISLRSEDLVAIPGSRPSRPKPTRALRPDPIPKSERKARPSSMFLHNSDPFADSSSPPEPPTATVSARPARKTRAGAPRVLDEEETKLEHISKLMAELEVESSSDEEEIRRLFDEFRRVRRERRGVQPA